MQQHHGSLRWIVRRQGPDGAVVKRSDIKIEVVTHGQAVDGFWGVVRNGVKAGAADMGVLMGGGSELQDLQADLEMLARREARGEDISASRSGPTRTRFRSSARTGTSDTPMATTIADVARRARASTATVSRVLAGHGRARPETRERVFAAAHDRGYRPSGVARSLRQRATRTLSLIITDIETPFFPKLVRAVEDAARDLGYAILLCNAADHEERETGYLDLLVDRWVDGVVIAASNLGARHHEWLADAPLPIVLVNSTDHEIGLSSIASDNRAGGRLAADHLRQLGHRRFGLISASPPTPASWASTTWTSRPMSTRR